MTESAKSLIKDSWVRGHAHCTAHDIENDY